MNSPESSPCIMADARRFFWSPPPKHSPPVLFLGNIRPLKFQKNVQTIKNETRTLQNRLLKPLSLPIPILILGMNCGITARFFRVSARCTTFLVQCTCVHGGIGLFGAVHVMNDIRSSSFSRIGRASQGIVLSATQVCVAGNTYFK